MRCSIIGKENAWEARSGVERVALIKSLIYARQKVTHLRHGCQIKLNLSANTNNQSVNFVECTYK